MRNLRLPAALAVLTATYAMTSTLAAKAFNLDLASGASCQLSIPTTDTGVRPKASGFRNESTTTSSFVICTFQRSATTGDYSYVGLVGYSLDGVARDVTCTATTDTFPGVRYSSKTASVQDAGDIPFVWSAADFGGTAGNPISGSLYFTVTCNLRPQTAISYIQAQTT